MTNNQKQTDKMKTEKERESIKVELSTLAKLTLPVKVLVEMELYSLSDGDLGWVVPLEENHSTDGVCVKMSRIHKFTTSHNDRNA